MQVKGQKQEQQYFVHSCVWMQALKPQAAQMLYEPCFGLQIQQNSSNDCSYAWTLAAETFSSSYHVSATVRIKKILGSHGLFMGGNRFQVPDVLRMIPVMMRSEHRYQASHREPSPTWSPYWNSKHEEEYMDS